ncbi:conserved Plasmodium membrane protein, unknown function [Plasmodium sp. DRC-Itaito]|nr:conserved Plasmodium membrane protein, unknown function [Plasmodium sp. DRC-Itaito]
MSDNYQFLQFYNVYKDNRNKWGTKINKLNFNLDNYKSSRTKIFLYTLWYSIIFTYFVEFFFNLFFFFLYMPYTNIISKTIFFLSIVDCIFVIILTCRSFYAYSYDKSKSFHTLVKLFFALSVWCFIKLLIYVTYTIICFAFISNHKHNYNHLFFYPPKNIYFNYFMEFIITINIVKSVLTLFTGQKIQYILSCIRTSTILKSKIRKDLEKQSFLFDDYTYGTFLND